MEDARLRELIETRQIVDLMTRYASGVDRRERALYRSCFSDVLDVDMLGQRFDGIAADEWVDIAFRGVATWQVTQHLITNHDVVIEGDEARCTAYVQAQHWSPDRYFLLGGTYANRLERSPDGWRITRLTLTMTWSQQP